MKNKNIMQKRLSFFFIVTAAMFVFLGARAAYLQLYDAGSLAVMASGQYFTELTEAGERGRIYDRNGNAVTEGEMCAWHYITDPEAAEEIAKDAADRYDLEMIREYSGGYSVWKGRYDSRQAAELKERYGAFTAVCRERYSSPQPAVHLTGYVSSGEGIGGTEGKCGLEKMYDDFLNETGISRLIARDAAGSPLEGGGILTEQKIDSRLVTTLDLTIQEEVEEILEKNGNPGAIVVTAADTGEILASASWPVYDPGSVADYLESDRNELMDRVTSGEYPPGSVFKIVVAAAAMEAGIADEESLFQCSGSVTAAGVTVRCSTGGEEGHGEITLREAFARSCNCAFIRLGIQTGGERILKMARTLGLGEDVCPQLAEDTGNLPESALSCGIANLSIGQGTILATPLQISAMMNCIASGGFRMPLKILSEETEDDLIKYDLCPPAVSEAAENVVTKKRVLSKKTAASLQSMMKDTVYEGTAADIMGYARYAEKNTEQNEAENDTENVRDPELSIAGKTGSAQSVMSGRKVVHGWFSGFCPAEEPEYVITIFMEDGGGSASCLPAAARLASFLSGLP